MNLLKAAIRRAVYNFFTYHIVECITSFWFHVNGVIPGSRFAYIFLSMVRMQLDIGLNIGLYSYAAQEVQKKFKTFDDLKALQKQVIDVVSAIRIGPCAPDLEQESSTGILFATSFVYHVGGHTRLLQTFLSGIVDARLYAKYVLRSGQARERNSPAPATLFLNQTDRVLIRNPGFRSIRRQILEVYRDFERLAPSCIILFNQPCDVGLLIASILYRRERAVPIIFYHHADDYVPFLGDVFDRHIDIDPNQNAKCAHIPLRDLIRISVRDRGIERIPTGKSSLADGFTIFSFVPVAKIEEPNGQSSFAVLLARLTSEGIGIVLATNSGHSDRLSALLISAGCKMECVTIDDDCIDIDKYAGTVHAYLDTFPVGGGMSVIDALSMRLPVMIFDAPRHQIFRDETLSHFMFSDMDSVCEYIRKMAKDASAHESECAFAYSIFRQSYSQESMVAALLRVMSDFVPDRRQT